MNSFDTLSISNARLTTTNITKNIYFSTNQRDTSRYPSASDFVLDSPVPLTQVHGICIKHYKYTPEALVNNNSRTLDIIATSSTGQSTTTINIKKGDYENCITHLLSEINSYIKVLNVQFAVDPTSGKVTLSFAGDYVTDYIAFSPSRLLRILGFSKGVAIYRTSPPSLSNHDVYQNVATANGPYHMINDTSLVLRITDIETVHSIDQTCNRATAIMMSSRSKYNMVEQHYSTYFPLIQVQYRVQTLRIKLLNIYGDLYDLDDDDASFSIEFHCNTER